MGKNKIGGGINSFVKGGRLVYLLVFIRYLYFIFSVLRFWKFYFRRFLGLG